MNKMNWIKMGCLLAKVLVLIVFSIIACRSTSTKSVVKVENFNFNKSLGMSAKATKDEEEKPKPVEEKPLTVAIPKLTGDITGYAADCPLCNGTLACKPSYKVYKNNVVTYNDSKYGKVRIVASSTKMPCGSIVRFNMKSVSSEPITAIVLDRGVLGNDLDLLMATEKDAINLVGRKHTTYEVLRRGW